MIRINLLPFRAARKQENVRQQVSVFGLSLLLLVVVLWGGNFFLSGKVQAMQQEKSQVEVKLKEKEGLANEVRNMQEHLKMVQTRLDAINVLKADRAYPVHLLDDITGLVVAKRMWLTELKNDPTQLEISGFAIDSNTVAQFLKNLEDYGARDNRFASVDLQRVEQSKVSTLRDFKEFKVICRKASAAAEAAEAEAGKGAPPGKKKGK